MDGDKLRYLDKLAYHLRDTYNFANVTIRGGQDSGNRFGTELTPALIFDAVYNASYTVKFTIAWHPSYNVPCVFFQIFSSEGLDSGTEDADDADDANMFDSQTLTFNESALQFLTNIRHKHLVKSQRESTPASIATTRSNVSVDIYIAPANTYFFIHPCQTSSLAEEGVYDFRWLDFFLAALGMY